MIDNDIKKSNNNNIIDDYDEYIKQCEEEFYKYKLYNKKLFYDTCIDVYNRKNGIFYFQKIKFMVFFINGKIIVLNIVNIIL